MRTPRIAGTWYPDSAAEIERLVGIGKSAAPALPHPAVLIVPHAGYAYSGAIAARAYARLPADDYDRVIILAPSHRIALGRTFSVEPADEVATPFGPVTLTPDLHDALAALPGARFTPEAHPCEHAIDIQLPLVKRFLPRCAVGAMIVGQWGCRADGDGRALAAFGAAFRKLLAPRTLVIVSTDFTHYGRDFGYVPFTDDVSRRLPELDAEMFAARAKNDNRAWSAALDRTGATVCGVACLHLLLAALPESARFERLEYATSADVTGDWSHVVGYTTGAVYANWKEPLKRLAEKVASTPALLSDAAGNVLYTYDAHWIMVNRLKTRQNVLKITQICLTALSTGGFLASVIAGVPWLSWIGGLTSAIALGLNLYSLNFNLPSDIKSHTDAANEFRTGERCHLRQFQFGPDRHNDTAGIVNPQFPVHCHVSKHNLVQKRSFCVIPDISKHGILNISSAQRKAILKKNGTL